MKKNYLRIDVYRQQIEITVAFHLLTDNVTSLIYEKSIGQTRIYFKDANPFAFIRVYIDQLQFRELIPAGKAIVVEKEGSEFHYSIVSM